MLPFEHEDPVSSDQHQPSLVHGVQVSSGGEAQEQSEGHEDLSFRHAQGQDKPCERQRVEGEPLGTWDRQTVYQQGLHGCD